MTPSLFLNRHFNNSKQKPKNEEKWNDFAKMIEQTHLTKEMVLEMIKSSGQTMTEWLEQHDRFSDDFFQELLK